MNKTFCPHCNSPIELRATLTIVERRMMKREMKADRDEASLYEMSSSLADVTNTDMNIRSNRGSVYRASKELVESGYTYKQVLECYGEGGWWDSNWRGKDKIMKTRITPTLKSITSTIKEAVTYQRDNRYVEVKE